MKKGRLKRRIWCTVAFVIILLNVLAAIHAYKFTHFTTGDIKKTAKPEKLSFSEKLKTLFTGVNNPRPVDSLNPEEKFIDVKIKSNVTLDCWYIPSVSKRGTVIMFHGYGSSKSALVENAAGFYGMGFSVLMVDFMGSGKSEGNSTTIGYCEAQEVKSCYDYVAQKGEKNIILYGGSMGAAAILKAKNDYPIKPQGVIIECPFGSMYKTVCARFHNMGIPTFPMASLLTFWGGVENGFWAFSYKPTEYATAVKCPTLLMYGAKDKNVSREEIDEIYANLPGNKELRIFPESGHENYVLKYKREWFDTVRNFLDKYKLDTAGSIYRSDTMDLPYFPPVWGYRFVVTGHFAGTGKRDTLFEHYYSKTRHRETNKFFDSVDYDGSVGLANEQEPSSFFLCSNPKIDTLMIANDNQLFGVSWMKNDGDLLGNGRDVMEYVIDWADWSSINTCHLVTWDGKKWKELYAFTIHDWEIPQLPGFATGYGLFGVDGGTAISSKYDTVNLRLEKELKAFPGFIKNKGGGVVKIDCWIAGDQRTIIVNLHHPKSMDKFEEEFEKENEE